MISLHWVRCTYVQLIALHITMKYPADYRTCLAGCALASRHEMKWAANNHGQLTDVILMLIGRIKD